MSTIVAEHRVPQHVTAANQADRQPTEAERAPRRNCCRLIWGIHISRAVYAVAELGIADLLADGPPARRNWPRTTGTHEPSLYRVLPAARRAGGVRGARAPVGSA